MNYSEAVRYLLSLGGELAAPTQAAAAKFDLENIRTLAQRLGHPQQAYPSVHIAGTNGKGSIAEIAAEKAGILKPGIPVVSAAERPEARAVIARRAAELGCALLEVDAAYRVENESSAGGCFRATIREAASGWKLGVAMPLPGRFQLRNALAAAAVARILAARGFAIEDAAISRGLSSVQWPA